jgi:hypothetical protein
VWKEVAQLTENLHTAFWLDTKRISFAPAQIACFPKDKQGREARNVWRSNCSFLPRQATSPQTVQSTYE